MQPIILDIETCPHPCAGEFIPAPDLDAIKPAGNVKDPVKVAASLAERKAAAVEDHKASLSRAALDWNLSRIVAFAWIDMERPQAGSVVMEGRDEAEEAEALAEMWKLIGHRPIIGFCARTFDVPTLIQRSRLLGIKPVDVSLARYGRGDVIDLRDLLTFDDARYEALMPRSLKMFCKRFGVPVHDDINGADIPALVAAGDWDSVRAHVRSDVQLTAALAARLGVIAAPVPEPVF
jgi:hypothetical protein